MDSRESAKYWSRQRRSNMLLEITKKTKTKQLNCKTWIQENFLKLKKKIEAAWKEHTAYLRTLTVCVTPKKGEMFDLLE